MRRPGRFHEQLFFSRRSSSREGSYRSARRCRPLRCEILEPRHLLSGVTLITHGFNSGVDDWVAALADAITTRPDLASDQPLYRVAVTDPGHDGGPLSVVNTSRSGPAAAECSGGTDLVILLDWSDVAGTLDWGGGYHRSTVDVAAAVAEKLCAPNFLADLAAPVAELPFHLIGHSRGASLAGELAKDLGKHGVWVDQVTTLDPHPVDGVREPSWPLNFNFGDAAMTGWENVAFWDNYWRTDGSSSLDFTGESVANVYNVQLSEDVLTNGAYYYEHSDVHLWYHGTIDTSPTAYDGEYTVPANWYGGVHPARNVSGFYYSLLVGGTRQPSGLSDDLGGAAVRTAIDWSAANWPNVLNLNITGNDFQFNSGESIPVSYYHQDYDSVSTVSFSLDTDQNPYISNALGEWNENLAQTGSVPILTSASLNTVGLPDGTYYVAAKITDPAGHTRYAYAHDPITITTPVPITHTWTGGGEDNLWSTTANWDDDTAPIAGDNLLFPETAARLESVNDYPAGTVFGSITVAGNSYRFQSNGIASDSAHVQNGAQLEAPSIVTGTLTIGGSNPVGQVGNLSPKTVIPISNLSLLPNTAGQRQQVTLSTGFNPPFPTLPPASKDILVFNEVKKAFPQSAAIATASSASSPALQSSTMAEQTQKSRAVASPIIVYNDLVSEKRRFSLIDSPIRPIDPNWFTEIAQAQVQKNAHRKIQISHQALDLYFTVLSGSFRL